MQTENIKFYLAAREFKEQTAEKVVDGPRVATQILDEFIRQNSRDEVNIPSTMRVKIIKHFESAMDSDVGVPADLFNPAETEVFNLMARDSFQRFLKGNLCKEYFIRNKGSIRILVKEGEETVDV